MPMAPPLPPLPPPTIMNDNPSPSDNNADQGFQNFDFAAAAVGLDGQGSGLYAQDANTHHVQQPNQQGGHGPMPPPMAMGVGSNLDAIQSLLAQQAGEPQGTTNMMNQASAGSGDHTWQSCRFCQQKFFVTSERLLEHEISCPMHIQVQQFLQQQQLTRQGGQFGQLQAQMQQLKAQQASLQSQGESMQQLAAMQGQLQGQYQGQGGMLPNVFGAQYGNTFAPQDAQGQMQGQGLSLLQHQVSQGSHHSNPMDQNQQFQSQASHGSSHGQLPATTSPLESNQDQFESAIDRLPAFDGSPSNQQAAASTANVPLKPLQCSGPHSTTDYFPLAMPEDEEWLTPLHCFVRRYCVEVFVATPEDVAAPCMGKRNPVSVSQVGIRCPYCSPERMGANESVDVARARENGVVYPSLIGRIYNSSINLLQRHLRSCAFVPPEILARYEELKSSNARSGASKKYWADSAQRLGLLDTPDGIRLDKELHRAHREGKKAKAPSESSSLKAEQVDAEAPPLVLPSDKRNTTAFTFHLMSQMQPCVFTEADRLGRRRNLDVGFAGLACRHCFGVYGSGRFFPSSVKTMADASKTLDVVYRHVLKCKNCPTDIKGGLRNLRDFHDSERSKMPFGNQRAFFVKIWGRLHEGCANDGGLPGPRMAALPAPAPSVQTNVALPIQPMGERKEDSHAAKLPAAPSSVHGLYAMVKRSSEHDSMQDLEPNKVMNEAA